MAWDKNQLSPITDYQGRVLQWNEYPGDKSYACKAPAGGHFKCPIPDGYNYAIVKANNENMLVSQTEELTVTLPDIDPGGEMAENTRKITMITRFADEEVIALFPESTHLYFRSVDGINVIVNFYKGPEMNSYGPQE